MQRKELKVGQVVGYKPYGYPRRAVILDFPDRDTSDFREPRSTKGIMIEYEGKNGNMIRTMLSTARNLVPEADLLAYQQKHWAVEEREAARKQRIARLVERCAAFDIAIAVEDVDADTEALAEKFLAKLEAK